ncbi:MAG TPA: gluconate 2-dehydrogenase subunit 3 family protein [Gemmatimonadaceae bacterium]|nr:gluconate 2-dehydrogenase subunit 3 family protein [Gemmatimonadaceae bacterium]
MTRRDALKAFAVVGMANMLGVETPHMERTLRNMELLDEQQGAPYAPKFFTRHEWRTVRMLSDYVIPRDDRSGSATDAKVPEFMDFLLSDKDASEWSKTSMRGGLAWIDNQARHRFQKDFVEATDTQRREILDDIAWPKKAKPEFSHGVNFFNRFRDLTASGFFSSAMGWRDVQYIGNTFNPNWNGCPPAALQKLGVSYDVMNTRTNPTK